MFEGEPDHLTPSTAQFLLESDMFLVAETTTIQIEDCPDIDIRTTIQLLEGNAELTKQEEKAVFDVALSENQLESGCMNGFYSMLWSVIQRIVWPIMEEDEDECCLEDKCRVAGYLRIFIEKASCAQLKALLQFWTGWELLPSELTLKVVSSDFPKSATCFETLRLPAHYHDYEAFVTDIQACLNSTDTGFGLV
ncbi:hypothetical protein NQZ68_024332 [Dissostichus eleginoides]|nr:hypothetical protein NQZ68_024332 [Dissostichus eleginoides]